MFARVPPLLGRLCLAILLVGFWGSPVFPFSFVAAFWLVWATGSESEAFCHPVYHVKFARTYDLFSSPFSFSLEHFSWLGADILISVSCSLD